MKPISTPDAPAAIGTYSQAVRAGDTVYLSGQIPLDPKTMQIVEGFENQVQARVREPAGRLQGRGRATFGKRRARHRLPHRPRAISPR